VTEAEFNTSGPERMLSFLRASGKATDRKLRLFAVACCRRLEVELPDQRSWDAVHVAEWYADGNGTDTDLAAARSDAEASFGLSRPGNAAVAATASSAWEAAVGAVAAVGWLGWEWYEEGEEKDRQADLVRDISGPLPFRPIRLDPSWRTHAVMALATAIYDDRRWDDMPVLGDALQEAGCSDAELLAHCHGPAFHARGCWALDLLLNKE
jgi:hypothetical protein